MNEFSYQQHIVKGDADTAAAWVAASSLPVADKDALQRFVGRFPSLTFVQETDTALDHLERESQVTLPEWFRETRRTLAFVDPPVRVRVDAFEWDETPRADYVNEIWYELEPGYHSEEIRETLFGFANMYLIGGWWENLESDVAVSLADHTDQRIFEFALEDLWDGKANGDSANDSLSPIFSSYAQFLGQVVEVQLADGSMLPAQEPGEG